LSRAVRITPLAEADIERALDELYERWLQFCLLPTQVVEEFHFALSEYVRSPDPVLSCAR